MTLKKLLLNNKNIVIDLFFILSIFLSPIISKIGFYTSSTDSDVISILVLACWILIKVVFSKLIINFIKWFDIGVFISIIYVTFHFILFSEASFYYYKLWLYLGYILIFYMLRWTLNDKKFNTFLIEKIVFFIVILGILQSIIAILQYHKIIQVRNQYFFLLGSFSSPNFLAAFLGLCITILLWYLFVKKPNKKYFWILSTSSLLILLYVVILSNSRGAWLATATAIFFLLLTSKKTKSTWLKIFLYKKVIFVLCLLLLIVIGAKYLYALKPESVKGRAFVAKISLQEISKAPVKGHGLFSFPGKYNKAKASYFKSQERTWEEKKIASYVSSPFNDYILIAFELGILGLILILTLVFWILFNTKINRETRLGISILLNILVFALFNSPLSSLLIMIVGLLGISIILNYGECTKKTLFPLFSNSYINKSLMLTIAILCIYLTVFKITYKDKIKTYSIKRNSLEKFNYVSNTVINNAFYEFIIGKKLYDYGYHKQGKKNMEHAFQYSAAPKIGRALAYMYLKESNYKRAEEIFKFNMYVEPYRYRPKMDLLHLYLKTERYYDLISLSQKVIDFPVKIESETINQYKEEASNYIKHYQNLSY